MQMVLFLKISSVLYARNTWLGKSKNKKIPFTEAAFISSTKNPNKKKSMRPFWIKWWNYLNHKDLGDWKDSA